MCSRSALVFLHPPPLRVAALAQDKFYFAVSPEDVSAPAGSSAVLRCAVSESRGISYGWTYNGRPVTTASSRRQAVLVDGGAESQLRIGRLDRVRDQGEVACTATNTSTGFSLTSRAAVVHVQCKSETTQPYSLQRQPPPLAGHKFSSISHVYFSR